MTIKEYAEIEERFKNDTVGKCIDYDGQYGGQCWDSAEVYFTQYLGLPASILAECGVVNNMLYPPKINELLEYFDEVDIHNMIKGDTVIWDWGKDLGHIAVFDTCPDGYNCYFVTQNNPTPNITEYAILDQNCSRAFRLKGLTAEEPQPTPPAPEPVEEFKVGDYVIPTILLDYEGTPLVQYDDLYQIIEKDERGNVLGAVRGDERPIWAVLPDSNIKKAN